MHAVLGVDLQPRAVGRIVAQDFVDAGRAKTLFRASYLARLTRMGVSASFNCRWQGWSSRGWCWRGNRRQPVEGQARRRAWDRRWAGRLRPAWSFSWSGVVLQGPRRLAPEDDLVDAEHDRTQVRPLAIHGLKLRVAWSSRTASWRGRLPG